MYSLLLIVAVFSFFVFIFALYGLRTSTQRPGTVTVFVIKALIRDQSDGSIITPSFSQRKLTLLSSYTTFNEAGIRARRLDHGFVSVKTCREAVSVYCLVGGMMGGETPTPKSRCKNLIAGTTCIPRRSLFHFSRKSRKKSK